MKSILYFAIAVIAYLLMRIYYPEYALLVIILYGFFEGFRIARSEFFKNFLSKSLAFFKKRNL